MTEASGRMSSIIAYATPSENEFSFRCLVDNDLAIISGLCDGTIVFADRSVARDGQSMSSYQMAEMCLQGASGNHCGSSQVVRVEQIVGLIEQVVHRLNNDGIDYAAEPPIPQQAHRRLEYPPQSFQAAT